MLALIVQACTATPERSQPAEMPTEAVTQLAYEYLSAKDARDYERAYSLMRGSLQAQLPIGQFIEDTESFNDQAGPVRERRINRITWYTDPPNAPRPGLYAAVDLVSTFENIDRHCGYLVFFQEPSGAFLIVREEENYMDRATEESIRSQQSQEAVEAMWAELARHCPG